jgi:molecular chaperone DnaK
VPKAYVGIDLGTTNTTCAVAHVLDNGTLDCRQIKLLQPDIDPGTKSVSFRHDNILPSVVWLADADQVYTGVFALEHADLILQREGSKVIHAIKSELANRHWALVHEDQTYTPAEISSCVLRTVYASLVPQLRDATVEGVTITIPASFSSAMRRETLSAAQMAGLPMDKVVLLDEPIAAVFSDYGNCDAPFPNIDTNEPILVFDMGGGTVDVTALRLRPDERAVQILSTSRYNQVAGDDLDLEIAAYLWRRLGSQEPAAALTRVSALALLRAGERVKRAINDAVPRGASRNISAVRDDCRKSGVAVGVRIDLSPDLSNIHNLSVPVADVLDVILPFLSYGERQANYGRNIFTPILEALDRAGLTVMTVKQVHLVGGGANFHPVYLELQSFFGRVSSALDPSYAVSRGAAKFAALSGSLGWRISETTSERIYLRRTGQTFLEVLPDKLPIPSEPRPPAYPLKENYTVELTEKTRSVRLEFYQGTEDNDPQMTPIHDVTLRFEAPLPKGTVIHTLIGHVDANKIYRFEIGLREPAGRVLKRTVEFSADTGTRRRSHGPRYQLNKRKLFEDVVQRDPLRALIEGRIAASRVAIVGARTSPPASVLASSLHAERNTILKAINESWANAYIGDKYLPTRMRATLADLQDLQFIPGVDPTNRSHLELTELYKAYGAVIIRSLLDHSFLLYGTHGLKQKLATLVGALADDLASDPKRLDLLLHDLDQHADSPYDVVRTLVEIFLSSAKRLVRVSETILATDAPYRLPLKLLAARLLCEPQDAAPYLAALLKQHLALNLQGEDFERRVRPLISALVQTGDHGFEEARDAFERRQLSESGSLVLGSFGETFYRWAVGLPKISPWYVGPVFEAIKRIESRVHRKELLELLLDKWSADAEVWKRTTERLRRNPKVLINAGLKYPPDVVLPSAESPSVTAEIIQAARDGDEGRLRVLRKNNHRIIVKAIVDAFASLTDEQAGFLLDAYTRNAKSYFVRKLVEELLTWRAFKRIDEIVQIVIVQRPVTREVATIERLQRIHHACKGEAQTAVMRLIREMNQVAG